jgi:eukaryotic-like serine/threonine-protein kinase
LPAGVPFPKVFFVATNQLSEPIQFGKYTLFDRIGRGGMAEVFKGRIQGPAGFERVFVVKRILPHLSDDQTFIKMFVEEAKLSARLNHPNIVHIFELGAVEGEYFISMEYIRGHDLSETMRSIWKALGPPRPELVSYIGREACRGLAYAHGLTDENGRLLGMIHRDVSPSNVMLSYEGAVKMLDFGIAKALGDTADSSKSGTMKGKYAYMAPEQTEGDNIDHRSDIFAVGIVLHEVLTGRRLFKGQNDVQTIERVRRCEVPKPSLQNPAVPPELDQIVLKALQRDPARRWSNAADMADALDDIVHAARFQPTHLTQILYDLFPPEGGAPAPRTGSSRTHSRGSTASGAGVSRRTVPPVSRTASGASAMPFPTPPAGVQQSLKPKSKMPSVLLTLAVLAGGGFGGWKYLGSRQGVEVRSGNASDPARRFHVFVKSNPEGADIYLGDGKRPIGATPVTLPIDLSGVTSVRLRLKKVGYDDYEQLVADDTPLSISMTPQGQAPAGTGGAPAPSPPSPRRKSSRPSSSSSSESSAESSPSESPGSSSSGSSSHRRRAAKAAVEAPSGEPTGEITD